MKTSSLKEAYNACVDEVEARQAAWDELADDASEDDVNAARTALTEATEAAERAKDAYKESEALDESRGKHTKLDLDKDEPSITVTEPDMYTKDKPVFLRDLFLSQLRNDPSASERINKHQMHELGKMPEGRAISTGTLGGIIPPQYLVDMYAKASRAGRVFVDQCSGQDLPDEGMSLIIPRLTQGTVAGVQASEGSTVATQDVEETDLTVPVRTIAGYVPVSRQTLERASYSEPILFEDLIARYWAELDLQTLVGTGSSGQLLGVFNTEDVTAVSANSDGSIGKLWATLADAQQQILTKWGGLGVKPAKIFMHPRRWGQIVSYLDENNRPLFGYNNVPVFNVAGQGTGADYGYVGNLQGLPVYTDANIPTNLDTNSDRDAIVVTSAAPGAPLCWERQDDPVTLAFEQQAGTALQVQLIVYGYAAFTAGRYPEATAVIDDFPAPTFS